MKADIWEGGHRVPFIATWPNKIKANTISYQTICLTDVISSIASILGIKKSRNEMPDSFDISPILFGKEKPVRESIVHHSIDGTFAIRKDDWKLIIGNNSGGFSKALDIKGIPVQTKGQLYNLSKDPSEKNNLYATHPNIVKQLTELLNTQKSSGYSME